MVFQFFAVFPPKVPNSVTKRVLLCVHRSWGKLDHSPAKKATFLCATTQHCHQSMLYTFLCNFIFSSKHKTKKLTGSGIVHKTISGFTSFTDNFLQILQVSTFNMSNKCWTVARALGGLNSHVPQPCAWETKSVQAEFKLSFTRVDFHSQKLFCVFVSHSGTWFWN